MKRLLLIIILMAGGWCWSQETDFTVPDSLLVALEQNPKTDMKRVEALSNIIDYCNKNCQYQMAQP